MKKVCFVLGALAILGGFFMTSADAGQLCWQVDTASDVLYGYMNLMASGGKWTRAVHGAFKIQGSNIPVSGNMVKSADGNNWLLQVSTNIATDHIDIGATLNTNTLSGSAVLVSLGESIGSANLTFTSISCKSMPTP